MLERLDARAARRWALRSLAVLSEQREDIDRSNVYPVADHDTGTNLLLTLEAGVTAVEREWQAEGRRPLASLAATFAHGSLLGARGNSGVILSQLMRGWAEVLLEQPGGGPQAVAAALRRGADQAYAALSRPVEGTMLSVARAAADGARGGTLAEVTEGAVRAARMALTRTPRQLEALARAGVVDAGGRGLLVLLETLSATVQGQRPVRRRRASRGPVGSASAVACTAAGGAPDGADSASRGPAYEVMYLLDAGESEVVRLRAHLDRLGESLVVVGGGGLWNVHVHTDDVGGAIEAGIAAGRPHRVVVTRLEDPALASATRRPERGAELTVLATAAGPGLARLFREHGAAIVGSHGARTSSSELLEACGAVSGGQVVLLPHDRDALSSARTAAAVAGERGRQVTVLATRSSVQVLAALAVHDGGREVFDDLVSMAAAAAATRSGVVRLAGADQLTAPGPGRVGQDVGLVVGLVEDAVVEVGDDPLTVALAVATRMLAAGGELLTLVAGAASEASSLAEGLSEQVRARRPDIEVSIVDGGQPASLLLLGVE